MDIRSGFRKLAQVITGLLLWWSPTDAVACTELPTLATALRDAIDTVELDRADTLIEALPESLQCATTPVSPLALHAALVAAGAAHHFQGRDADATILFGWAASVAPTSLPDPALGEGVLALYTTARTAGLSVDPATLVVGQGPLWVDGNPGEINQAIVLPPGPHVLQWTTADSLLHTEQLLLVSGQVHAIADGALPTSAAPRPKQPVWLTLGGGLSAVTGVGFLVGAAMAHTQFDQTTDPSQLAPLQQTVNTRTSIGAGLIALGGGAVVVSWQLPRGER